MNKGETAPALQARTALEDCKLALDELRESQDNVMFRRRWVAFLALAYAVVDVARKFDKNRLQKYGPAFDSLDKRAEIYEHFIRRARNEIQHTYRSGLVHPVLAPNNAGPVRLAPSSTGMALTESSIPLDVDGYEFSSGPFANKPLMLVAEDAVRFLETYIDKVERSIRNSCED